MCQRFAISSFHRAIRVAAVVATAVLAGPIPCEAQTFSPSGRMMRDNPTPSSRALLPSTPAKIAPSRSNVHWGLLFKNQVERCWKKLKTASKETTEAIFSLKLNRNGMIESIHVVSINPATDYSEAYLATCIRALDDCQPYELPDISYDEWRFFEPVFTQRVR